MTGQTTGAARLRDNTVNVKRTVHGYIQAGFAGIMIEDQRSPKRCGHTIGKEVVEREEALLRLRAVIEARDEARDRGEDIVIVACTDARDTHGLSEAIDRHLFLGGFLAVGGFWAKTHSAPVITAQLTKTAILARMFFEMFLLFFRNINFSL